MSVYRGSLGIKFETWRLLHDVLGPAILVMAFLHSWYAGGDLTVAPMQGLWVVLLTGAASLWLSPLHQTLATGPSSLSNYRSSARNPTGLDLKVCPSPGENRFDFLPDNFHSSPSNATGLTGGRASFSHFLQSPPNRPSITSTIKASGDFTATIGQTSPGELAIIQAPFGRFSYVLKPQALDLVFIAAGIGITPLMSNLRHMRDTRADRLVLLLYANKTENGIVFREELAQIEAGMKPQLQVIHLLTQPEAGWQGEKGRLDRGKLRRLCGNRLTTNTFFLSPPPAHDHDLGANPGGARGAGFPDFL